LITSEDLKNLIKKAVQAGVNATITSQGLYIADIRVELVSQSGAKPILLTQNSNTLKKDLTYIHCSILHSSSTTLWAERKRPFWLQAYTCSDKKSLRIVLTSSESTNNESSSQLTNPAIKTVYVYFFGLKGTISN
jgi:glycogen synthase